MRQKTILLLVFSTIFILFCGNQAALLAQTPCPRIGPCEEAPRDLPSLTPGGTPIPIPSPTTPVGSNQNFDSTKAQVLQVMVQTIPAYLKDVEKLIVENFWIYMTALLGVAIVLSLINYSMTSFDQNEDFLKWLIPAAFFVILIPISGDLNNDGRPGDLIGMIRYAGMQIFYGYDNRGNINDSSPIAYPVRELRRYYNSTYGDFVNKAYTVKLPDGTVTVPGPTGLEQRIRVQFSKGYKLEDIQKGLDPAGWKMETLFEWLNGGRFVFEITDVVIMVLHAFCDFFLRIMLPFVLLLSLDPTIRKRIWGNYLYFLIISSFVFPFVHQLSRIICYSLFDIVLSVRNVNPYYIFDATTQSILQNNGADPTLLIFTLTFLSLGAVFAFGLGCPGLTFAIATGNPFQWLVGTSSAAFTFGSSVTLSYLTSAVSGALGQEISEQRAGTNLAVGQLGLLTNYYRARELAKTAYESGVTVAQGYRDSSHLNLSGNYITGQLGSAIEQGNTVGSAMVNFDQAKGKSLLNAFEHLSYSQADWLKANYGLDVKEMQSALKAHPEFKDVFGKSLDQIPLLGSTFGLGDAVRTIQNLAGVSNALPVGEAIRKAAPEFDKTMENIFSGDGNRTLETLKKLGADSHGNFNSQAMANNLYGALEKMPGGAKLLGELGIGSEKVRSGEPVVLGEAMQNQPFQGPLQPLKGFETGKPFYSGAAQKAARVPITNPQLVYWNKSQEQYFRTTGDKTLDNEVLNSARFAGINPVLFRSSIIQESGGKQSAVSHKGAFGVTQLMPGTAAEIQRDAAALGYNLNPKNRSDNILMGAMYYRKMYDLVRGAGVTDGRQVMRLGLAAYNAGIGAVQKYDYQIPNYTETKDYVRIITGNFDRAMGASAPRTPKINQSAISPLSVQMPNSGGALSTVASHQQLGAMPNYAPSYNPLLVQPSQVQSNVRDIFNQSLYQLEGMGPSINRAAAEFLANKLEVQSGRDLSNFDLAHRQQLIANVHQGEVALAGRGFEQSQNLAAWTRGMRDQVAELSYGYGRAATDTQYNAQIKSMQQQLYSNLNVAETDYDSGLMQQKLIHEQALAEARMQAALQIIGTVGQTASHQFEQAMEKTNARY